MTRIVPRLIVVDADRAIAFYTAAFGARLIARFASPDGHVVHAELDVDGARFTLTEQERANGNDSPAALGGSPVPLTITVADARAVGARLEAAGAKVVFPIDDQFYGAREGRLRDPFGHLWIVSQPLVAMSDEEIQRGVDAFGPVGTEESV